LFLRSITATLMLAALTLGTSACSITGNVASLQPYSPSDGQQVDLDAVKARNFIYLVSDSGNGFLIGSMVNSSNEDRVVKLQYINSSTQERSDYYFEVPAGSKIDFGYNGSAAIQVPVIERAGQTAQFFLLESDTVNGSMRVPVLDGTLAEYRSLLEQLEAAQLEIEEQS